jgi:hypothetical protein
MTKRSFLFCNLTKKEGGDNGPGGSFLICNMGAEKETR